MPFGIVERESSNKKKQREDYAEVKAIIEYLQEIIKGKEEKKKKQVADYF